MPHNCIPTVPPRTKYNTGRAGKSTAAICIITFMQQSVMVHVAEPDTPKAAPDFRFTFAAPVSYLFKKIWMEVIPC